MPHWYSHTHTHAHTCTHTHTHTSLTETNQSLCSKVFPAALSLLQGRVVEMARPAVTLITSCIANNSGSQDNSFVCQISSISMIILPGFNFVDGDNLSLLYLVSHYLLAPSHSNHTGSSSYGRWTANSRGID